MTGEEEDGTGVSIFSGFFKRGLHFLSIELDRNCTYALGLYSFNVYNSIPNVQSGKNDKFYFLAPDNHSMSITNPEGAYEIDALERCIHDAVLEKLEALPPDLSLIHISEPTRPY